MGDVVQFKKKEAPKLAPHLQTFYDLSKKVDGAIKTTDHHLRKAHLAGEEIIKDKDGNINYDFLKQTDYQDKFAYAMSDTLFDAAKKYFKIGKDAKGDAVWNEQLINAYTGTTKSELLDAVRNAKNEFNYDYFVENHQSKLISALNKKLSAVPSSHLTKEHIGDILKHTGLENVVDKESIQTNQAVIFLDSYRREKAVGKSLLRKVVPDYGFKDKTYRSDYVEKKAA